MSVILPSGEFSRDPGAEALLGKYRLLVEDIFSPEGKIYGLFGEITGGSEYRRMLINPILERYFIRSFEKAAMIADNCAVIKLAGGLPPMHPLGELQDIPGFYRSTLNRAVINCYRGVTELSGLSEALLREAKERQNYSREQDKYLDEICSRLSDGYSLSVKINQQIEPTLAPIIDRTFPPPQRAK